MEDGHICGPGELGVMLLRGPQQMLGYRNLPEATARTIDDDGWVNTGRATGSLGQLYRPVATGGEGGGSAPLEKFEPTPRLRCPFCRNYRF